MFIVAKLDAVGAIIPIHYRCNEVPPFSKMSTEPRINKNLASFLSQYREIKLAILFGSLASGKAHSNSDIDLAILADSPISNDFKLQLINAIGAKFGRPVDIIDLYHAPEPILGQVFKGITLLGDNTTRAKLLTKHLLNTADFLPLHQRILTERRNRWIH